MDWHTLEKKKVTELRDMAKEKTSLQGVSGMSKDQLVEELAKVLGIAKPHKVAEGQKKVGSGDDWLEVSYEVAGKPPARISSWTVYGDRTKRGPRRADRRKATASLVSRWAPTTSPGRVAFGGPIVVAGRGSPR